METYEEQEYTIQRVRNIYGLPEKTSDREVVECFETSLTWASIRLSLRLRQFCFHVKEAFLG